MKSFSLPKSQRSSLYKNPLVKGTLILTFAGFLTRILGFFYKIYLSNIIGAENLGLYHLIFPVFAICATIYGSGVQTTISKLVAESPESHAGKILRTGLTIGGSLSLALTFIVFRFSEEIAVNILREPITASSLRIMCILFPFCCTASCINGYYYGKKKTFVPATTQLIEQLIRVVTVFLLTTVFYNPASKLTCELAVWGMVTGEIGSSIYNLIFILRKKENIKITGKRPISGQYYGRFFRISVPLTLTRLSLNILSSAESILIPAMLKKYGMSSADALSVLGILTGMALPFILFPSALSNSLSVMLLPSISEANAHKKNTYIENACTKSIHYCLIIGIFFSGTFLIFGDSFGTVFFNNEQAGSFIKILSWICPFLYLSATMGSILNGLGKTSRTFIDTAAGLALRIFFLLFLVPKNGIKSYLIGFLISQLTITLLDFLAVRYYAGYTFDAVNSLLKPVICVLYSGFVVRAFSSSLLNITGNKAAHLILLFLLYSISTVLLYQIMNIKNRPHYHKKTTES